MTSFVQKPQRPRAGDAVAGRERVGNHATLLLVDDERNILSALTRLFRGSGYRILTAESGRDGLEILDREDVDLVISDMRMPEMDGAAFLGEVALRQPDTMRMLLTGYTDLESAVSVINQGHVYCYVSKPWEDAEIRLWVRRALEQGHFQTVIKEQNAALTALTIGLEKKVEARTEALHESLTELGVTHQALQDSYGAAVKVFANLIEMRQGSLSGHSRRVAEHVQRLAERMELRGDDLKTMVFAARLHDVGTVGFPDALLNKPYHLMTVNERKQVATHPAAGQAALMELGELAEAGILILQHHERYDGSGYPRGLSGSRIRLGARIIAVADDYDALCQGLLEPHQLSPEEARGYLIKHRGILYDPHVLDTFIAMLDGAEPGRGPEVHIKSAGLKSGMLLTRDVTSLDGVVFLTRGHALNEHLIEKIRLIEQVTEWDFNFYVRTVTSKTRENAA